MRRKRFLTAITLLLVAAIAIPITAYAAYYNTYTTVATLPNGNGCNRTQGFAIGSTYAYSAKCNDDNTKQVIYRTNQNDGSTTLMSNGDNSTTYTTYLGHANDMDTCTIGDVYHLFVATMKSGSDSLVKMHYSGTTYYKDGGFQLKFNGSDIKISGVKKYSKDANYVYFLFYRYWDNEGGVSLYKGKVPLNANSGVINVTHAFDINIKDALVNGSKISNIEEYTKQGIGYIDGTDQLLIPLTYNNVSVVLVYNNASAATGTITANSNLSFRITSSAYPNLFEIEGCDEANGRLYFNCNRKETSSDILHDAVCYFNGYTP